VLTIVDKNNNFTVKFFRLVSFQKYFLKLAYLYYNKCF